MIKLIELKKAIKSNCINNMFHVSSLTKVIFNFNNKIIIDLQKLDLQKFYDFLKTQNMLKVNSDYEISNHHQNENLIFTFESFKNTAEKNKNSNGYLLDTGIEFAVFSDNKKDKKVYKIFKSKNELLKIDKDLLSFIDLKEIALYHEPDNVNSIYIYNDYNDFIGLCVSEKFQPSELLKILE